MSPPRILILAGDPSGDIHAAGLLRALRKRYPSIEARAFGGPALETEGAVMDRHMTGKAVIGFREVLTEARFFSGALRAAREIVREKEVDLLVAVDYPGFNLRVVRTAHKAGVPVLYYIAPQVWAWGRSRAARMARWCDEIAVVFPFEEDYFGRHGGNARFVGHPILDLPAPRPAREVKASLGLPPDARILALLPGSRAQEVKHHLGRMIEAAKVVSAAGLTPVISSAPGMDRSLFSSLPFPVHGGDARELLAASEIAAVKSGTSTIDCVVTGTPAVVVYRLSSFSYHLGRLLVDLPFVAMPNILLRRPVMPELIQDDFTPQRLARTLFRLLATDISGDLDEAKSLLGTPGAAERTAGIAAGLLS